MNRMRRSSRIANKLIREASEEEESKENENSGNTTPPPGRTTRKPRKKAQTTRRRAATTVRRPKNPVLRFERDSEEEEEEELFPAVVERVVAPSERHEEDAQSPGETGNGSVGNNSSTNNDNPAATTTQSSPGNEKQPEQLYKFDSINLKVNGRTERIQYDSKSDTVREDVSLTIRSLLGSKLEKRKPGFFLQDRYNRVHVLSRWLLENQDGYAYKVTTKRLEGFPKTGWRYLRNWVLFCFGVILLEEILGNPFPFDRMPKMHKNVYQSLGLGNVGIFVNFLYVLGWVVTSSLFSRLPAMLFYMKAYYPKWQGMQGDLVEFFHEKYDSLYALMHWRLIAGTSKFSCTAEAGLLATLAVLRVSVSSCLKYVAVLAIVFGELSFGATDWIEFGLALFLVAVFVLIILLNLSEGKLRKEFHQRMVMPKLEDQPTFPKTTGTSYYANRAELSWSAPPGYCCNYEIQYSLDGGSTWPKAQSVMINARKCFRGRTFTPIDLGALLVTAAVAIHTDSRRVHDLLFTAVLFAAGVLVACPFPMKWAKPTHYRADLHDLQGGREYKLRVWVKDVVTNMRVFPSEQVTVKVKSTVTPNRMFLILDTSEEYRCAPVLWGDLQTKPSGPSLKNEATEVDSFLETVQGALMDPEQISQNEDDPMTLLSFAQSGSKHFALSRNFLKSMQNKKYEPVLRIHPAGTRVGSYRLENDMWAHLRVNNSFYPAQFLIAFYIATTLLTLIDKGLSAAQVGLLMDLFAFSNIAYLILLALRMLGKEYTRVALLAIFIAVTFHTALL